jgi:hypothetical protein
MKQMRATVACALAVALCCAVLPVEAGPNVLDTNFERPGPTAVTTAQVAGLAPDGWAVTDLLACDLDRSGGRELAVVITVVNPQASEADWWLRWPGPTKLLLVAEASPTGPVLAEFSMAGGAPRPNPAANLPAPLFTEDLLGDGRPIMFVRTHQWDGGPVAWAYMNAIGSVGGRFVHVGRFGVRDRGGMYFLDAHPITPGREVILLHPLDEGQAQLAPRRYRAQVYGFANGYYVPVSDFETQSSYTDPNDAFANLRRYLWGK